MLFFIALMYLWQKPDISPIDLSRPTIHLGREDGADGLVFQKITSLAVNHQDALYVLDAGQNQIHKLRFSGERLAVLGRQGQGPGEFYNPQAIAVNGDYLWVTDFGNGRIQIFKNDEYLKTFKLAKPSAPYNVLRLKDQIILSGRTVDPHSGPIKVFHPDGRHVRDLNWFSASTRHDGRSRSIWNSLTLIPMEDSHILAGYRFDNALAVMDHQGEVSAARNMDDFYQKHETKNEGVVFPAGYSAMSFSAGPEQTILVAVCQQENKYCGVIHRFDKSLTKLVQRIDLGFSPRVMHYEPQFDMLFLASVQAEILIYDLP